MKFPLSWLKQPLETDASLDVIVETLTRIGLEVEGVEDPGRKLAAFTIAHVISAEQHPNADRLRVCMVDTGDGGAPVQVVCGAPNARAGMKSVFSPPGTYIPGKDMTLGKGVIRGVESNGMLCSGRELEVSEDHDGILDLPEDAPVGMGYAEWAGLSDPVIEINLTPNRPDAAGVYGIARDLAAAGIGKLRAVNAPTIPGGFPCPVAVKLDLAKEDEALCPAFALRLVRGVKNGPSPEWLQKWLKAIGLRPINALVDITNFLTFDHARPLHVFDAKKVAGALTVRRAKAGETLLALDGKTYTLDASMVVIADENGAESLAGIMGGEASGVDETTTDVLIESALWSPLNIARTGRHLGINTDARYRFERGVDPAFTLPGLEIATKLVMELCGGEPSSITLSGSIPETERIIDFPIAEVKRLTGLDVPVSEMKAILTRLGFWMSGAAPVAKVAVPSFRPDIEGKADLVEEITRIVGLDNVPLKPLEKSEAISTTALTPLQIRTRLAKRALASRGMVEAVTWSFISKKAAEMFGGGKPELALANPIAAELSDMRPSLIPGLILAAQKNADRGFGDVALFEVGQVFLGDGEGDQRIAAAGLRRGLAAATGHGRHWQGAQEADVYDVKADALALLDSLSIPTGGLQIVAPDGKQKGFGFLHPGRSAVLRFGPNIIGWFGELHPHTLEAMGAEGRIVAFELTLDALPAAKRKPTRAKPKLELSAFQPLSRDFAFVLDEGVEAEALLKLARQADRALVHDVRVFDVYAGKGIPPGKKSLGISITLQPRDKTLTEAEIEAFSSKLVADMAAKTGAILRG
jgi:phenylalanyl-tRNA synthetase beta chain